MFSYSRIIKDSYRLTLENPVLWLFGLFVAGGFSLNFLHFVNLPVEELKTQHSLSEVLSFIQGHPGILAGLSISILFFSVLGLVLTNWAKVVLILSTLSIIKDKRLELSKQIRLSQQPLGGVIKVSLFTSALILVVAGVFLATPFWWLENSSYQIMFWTLGAVIFVPLAFAISCVNIFTTYFMVVYGLNFRKGLNLGLDFFFTKWSSILGLAVILMVIYSVCFAAGIAFISLVQILLEAFNSQLGIWGISAIILISKVASGIFLWLLLAGLNVFFNASLLMMFLDLNTPIKDEKAKLTEEIAVSPATP